MRPYLPMRNPPCSDARHAGRTDQEPLQAVPRHGPAHDPLGPRDDPLAEDGVLQEVDERLRAEHADELVGGPEHRGEDGDPPERMGGPVAELPAETARDRRPAARDHRVVELVRCGEPLARDDVAQRLRVPSRERAPHHVDPAQLGLGEVPGEMGAEGLVPGERHQRERARADAARRHERLDHRRAPPRWRRRSAARSGDERACAERAPGASPAPWRCTATVGTTSTPSSRESCSASIAMPRLAASSAMLSASANGTPASASCSESSSPRRRFLASQTWRQTYPRSREQDVPRHLLVLGHGEQVVRPRRVHDVPGVALDRGRAARHLDGGAGVVRDGDVLAGERAEEDALADVRVARPGSRVRAAATTCLRSSVRVRGRRPPGRGRASWLRPRRGSARSVRRARACGSPPRTRGRRATSSWSDSMRSLANSTMSPQHGADEVVVVRRAGRPAS